MERKRVAVAEAAPHAVDERRAPTASHGLAALRNRQRSPCARRIRSIHRASNGPKETFADSPTMKKLRILTGTHAGAHLTLNPGAHVVSQAIDADIQITDWKHLPIRLTADEGNTVNVMVLDPASDTASPLEALEDFVPRRFKDVVLCIGSVDVAWPSDLKLMESLMRPPSKSAGSKQNQPGRRLSRRAIVCLAGASLTLLGGFAGLVASLSSKAEARRPPEPLIGRVHRALQATQVLGAIARNEQGRVVVEGLVDSAADAAKLRAALQPFAADGVLQRFASASDMAQSITDALANPGLAVHYRGDGNFVVTGSSRDLEKVRSALQRIAGDLGPLLGRIEVAARELPAPETVPVGALMTSDDLQYVQTRDGTKHLTVITVDPAASAPGAVTYLR
jgi:type III secretion protein D